MQKKILYNIINNMENLEIKFASLQANEAPVVPTVFDKKTNKKWVNWGDDNKFPSYIWNAYLQCSNLQAIVNTVTDYVLGNDLKINYTGMTSNENIEEIISKCVFDYVLFGGFTLECLRNITGDIVMVNYVDIQNVRLNEDLTIAFLSNKWGSYSGKDIIELPLFDPKQKQNHFILYCRGNITRNINPIPIWVSSLKSVEVLNQTRNFNLNNITNNFSGGAIITFNGTQIKAKEMKEIKENLEDKYTGSNNAGKLMVVNNPNGEGKVEVTRLQPDNMGDLYKSLQESSEHDLFVSFRINPMLLGLNEHTGFSSQEFENAYALYHATVIKPIRNLLINIFNKIDLEIQFVDFKIDWKEE